MFNVVDSLNFDISLVFVNKDTMTVLLKFNITSYDGGEIGKLAFR